jgi:pantoate--beta-alanine ligase
VTPAVLETAAAVRDWSRRQKSRGRRTALVPTMGALHAGHRALFRAARGAADVVVVSIFVNPAQFGPGEDYDRYPRPFADDLAACEAEGVEAVYAPTAATMYAPNHSTWVTEEEIALPMEGAVRPGHFRGVLTVVLKLLNAVEPDVAVFGRKDAQQALVIARMARDLDLPVEIRIEPTVREADGLAFSSRNARLAPEDRRRAPVLREAIRACVGRLEAGETDTARVRAAGLAVLKSAGDGAGPLHVDYLEVVDAESLRAPEPGRPGAARPRRLLVAGAIRLGGTRLIDNELFPGGLR